MCDRLCFDAITLLVINNYIIPTQTHQQSPHQKILNYNSHSHLDLKFLLVFVRFHCCYFERVLLVLLHSFLVICVCFFFFAILPNFISLFCFNLFLIVLWRNFIDYIELCQNFSLLSIHPTFGDTVGWALIFF
ncbi:hypothetical protein Smp_049450 [Schistosoma mansoni]|uniref:hypothetical protein n=1 Tax=Schistosoma mansoni TaxID=6183 RepID=UPI00022DC5ED|nr:hypothetical protein Smp_049450 [Schistosoma mansoni]|eukprot:XP_018649099.1 hypothetical protein Smp_049450 [Schistosoma mansoni]